MDQVLIDSGLAELVPLSRRGHAPDLLKLVYLLLGLFGLFGLPLGGVLLCLAFALALETLDYSWRQPGSLRAALLRPTAWERIRPPFYWALAISVGLVSLFLAGESLLVGFLRGGFVWLCFRALADTVSHPERTRSAADWVNWLRRIAQQVARMWEVWLSSATLALVVGFGVNLIAPAVWQSVGGTAWNRLLLFGGGIYLIAILALSQASRSTARSLVQDTIQHWEESQAVDVDEVLGSFYPLPGNESPRRDYTQQIEARLEWKNLENLVARVRPTLEDSLTQRVRWGGFLTSLSAFLFAFFFFAISVFLIVPRDVMTDWVSTGQPAEREITLAFDDFDDFSDDEFLASRLGADGPNLAEEPLPKVAFLEAVVLASLLLFRSASDRSALKSMANATPLNMARWLTLGTAYLALLETEFQYLYSGLVTRELAEGQRFRPITLRNEVLLARSAENKAGAYRSISDFLRLYGSTEWEYSPHLLSVSASYRLAKGWALAFLQFSPYITDRPSDLDQAAPPGLDPVSGKVWIWSGDRVADLASLDEARWYWRFVTHQPTD